MDDSIDVDDLFGDPNSLELGLAASAPTWKSLSQRFDELRLSGCCRKLAWSKLGAIAYISNDGQKVFLQNILCNADDGEWSLCDGRFRCKIAEAQSGHTFIHLCWHESGSDLAIVDSCGRVMIVSMSIALNAFAVSRSIVIDPDDDGNQPVGLMWLGVNRPVHAFNKASKTNGRWVYSRYVRRPLGPFHPLNKSALVCVTRSGHIRLLYQSQDPKWNEVHVDLQTVSCSDDILTHAALSASQGGSILMVTYSTQHRLFVYRVHIKWDAAPVDTTQQQPVGFSVAQTPTIQITHIRTEIQRSVFQRADNDYERSPSARVMPVLTHLDIVGIASDGSAGSYVEPYILAAFAIPVSALETQRQFNGTSSIVRWALESTGQSTHSSFDEIPPKRQTFNLTPKTELTRWDDIHFDKRVLSIDYFEAGSVVSLTFDDGSISFYDAKTMNAISDNEDLATISSMPQAGFNLPNIGCITCISFSPNGCLAVTLDEDSELHLHVMEHSFGIEHGMYNDEQFGAAVAALALAFSHACSNDSSSDDVMMIAARSLTPDTRKTFITEVYHALSVNADFTIEQDKLMNNPYIQKCFSMQAALGFNGRLEQRNLAAAIPWFTLQLRQISILFAYFLHFNKSGSDSECHEPDILRMVLGNVRWALDLAKYLIDDLFEIASSFDKHSGDQSDKKLESFSMLLVLSSIPRAFLKYICRGLRGIPSSFRSATNLSNESFGVYSNIVRLIEESPLRVDVYEKFLLSIDNVIKYTYQNAGFGSTDRSTPERDLLITASVPPVLQPAVVTILTNTMTLIRPDVDLLHLCTWDYSWLGIDDDKLTRLFRRRNEVDILKKTITQLGEPQAKSKQPKRRCARCCAVSEDTTSPKSLASFRLLVKTVVLRTCICGGVWMVENLDTISRGPVSAWK
ncbi:RNA polymerase II Mediator complex subunit Sin4, variant 1 [Coccidioides immitis RS]|uniref:Mediator of RNA polymerase II transcription subunit 16 n=1 Tax=Coccidioides immitis (strain RS) TaxID=246410 RepID=A0A0D8JVE2_COCIM|nr:RNA polymerase II Mediator complex subunit Sin4, variant 1 [Coccidioides immitis RS]KJF61295.1 RNA polymerase II Mediator complex subunit Sin4, variant 1 [Coccidioides immitis RS]